jgi:Sec-independent protein translocase protein TatA
MKIWFIMSVSFFVLTLIVTVVAWVFGPRSLTEGYRQHSSPVRQSQSAGTHGE